MQNENTPPRPEINLIQLHQNPVLAMLGCAASIEYRFWRRVNKTDGCWLWTGQKVGQRGYGTILRGGFKYDTGRIYAHRLSWILHNGEIPEGLDVCHTCDNTSCVRPDHLFTGTRKQNMEDCVAKGRSTKGERNPKSTLTASQVISMRAERLSGMTAAQLAAKYNVGPTHVNRIIRREQWRHV